KGADKSIVSHLFSSKNFSQSYIFADKPDSVADLSALTFKLPSSMLSGPADADKSSKGADKSIVSHLFSSKNFSQSYIFADKPDSVADLSALTFKLPSSMLSG
ncbi:MAG: hypothetical protein ACKO96_46365, partial [Flammeovirgaceae bacterium]